MSFCCSCQLPMGREGRLRERQHARGEAAERIPVPTQRERPERIFHHPCPRLDAHGGRRGRGRAAAWRGLYRDDAGGVSAACQAQPGPKIMGDGPVAAARRLLLPLPQIHRNQAAFRIAGPAVPRTPGPGVPPQPADSRDGSDRAADHRRALMRYATLFQFSFYSTQPHSSTPERLAKSWSA